MLGIFSENRLLIQTFSPNKGETMVDVQADYLSVDKAGPYKVEHYRY